MWDFLQIVHFIRTFVSASHCHQFYGSYSHQDRDFRIDIVLEIYIFFYLEEPLQSIFLNFFRKELLLWWLIHHKVASMLDSEYTVRSVRSAVHFLSEIHWANHLHMKPTKPIIEAIRCSNKWDYSNFQVNRQTAIIIYPLNLNNLIAVSIKDVRKILSKQNNCQILNLRYS